MENVLEQFGESMLALWTAAGAGVSSQMGLDRGIEPRHALTPVQSPDRLGEHIESIRAAREREGWDVGVLGHTHKAGHVGDWYHNSGSWVGPRNSFLRIDPEGHVRYFEWKGGRAVEHEEPLVRGDAEPEGNPLKKAAASVHLLFPRPIRPERSRLILMGQGALALGLGLYALCDVVRRRPRRDARLSGRCLRRVRARRRRPFAARAPRASNRSSASSIACAGR